MNRHIETFIGCDGSYEDSKIVIFGAPFDSTTSYRPGARFASKAMRGESYGLESYSPYQDKDLSDLQVFDAGDLELPFGDSAPVLGMIERMTSELLEDDKLPVMIGGEHLVTLGTVRAFVKRYENLHIIHFDAHTDLREQYLGERLSHATVMRRVWELVGDNKIFQFGIRSGEKEEFEWAKKHTYMQLFDLKGFNEILPLLQDKPVYFSLDLDVLDPSVFPGTGTPEAGGVGFMELLSAVTELGRLNIVGADINELCPVYDQSGVSTITACKVLRELLLAIQR